MDPTSPDPLDWISAYLTVHSLSVPSRRYSFILWLAVVLLFLVFAILHWTGSRGGFYGASWSKWAIRRRTWRKKHALALAQRKNEPHRQPVSLPSNAQLLALSALTLASFALAFAGPDYVAPSQKVWQIDPPVPQPQLYDPLPQSTISKSLWTSSARVGQIAFALLPLCVLFALKAPPFAIFAIPFMIQIFFDKLAWLHRWAGRLVWFLVCIHVLLWSIQLAKDVNPSTGRIAYAYAWSYTPFLYGWIAFALLNLIILFSLHPIRRRFYERFYFVHILLGPCMLVMAGLHHPSVAYWCYAALAVWVGERFWRATWWVHANGIIPGVALDPSPPQSNFGNSPHETWEMRHFHRSSAESASAHIPMNSRSPSPLNNYYLHDKSAISVVRDAAVSEVHLPSSSLSHSTEQHLSGTRVSSPYIPPPGYAHAELLSGRTVRLRLITPGFLSWSPGQHFLLNIPSVSRFASHPFSCASICDEQAPTDAGRVMVFLVRVKSGWTKDLWNLVSRLVAERSRGEATSASPYGLPRRGVLLRSFVDGPFGSAKRARWGNYSTAVIITGGSGVSFGLSLLQYMCMCLAGRDGKHLGGRPGGWGWKGNDLKRVRFIWLVREYSHIQWCASIIRKCTSIVPPSALQVDIFVTNFKPLPMRPPVLSVPPRAHVSSGITNFDEELEPPHPKFARENATHLQSESMESVESHGSQESDVDLSYYLGESGDDGPPPDELGLAHETNMLDLTNFDGDIDMTSPGEAYLSRKLKREGRLRRMQSRRLSTLERTNQEPRRLLQPSLQAHHDHYAAPLQSSRGPLPRIILPDQAADKHLPISPLSERSSSSIPERDFYSPVSILSESSHHVHSPRSSESLPSGLTPTVTLVNASGQRLEGYPAKNLYYNVKPEPRRPHAIHALPLAPKVHVNKTHSTANSTAMCGNSNPIPFEMDEEEANDVNIVSEHARPGKPKLDKVIADEVQASKGAIIVACCGPTSLNAMVRKIVAAQTDPGRIRRGDMRGSISLVSEEFEY